MNKQELLKKIIQKAKTDKKNRKDPRYLNVMGFLIAKGFLRINQNIVPKPNQHIAIEDALWAGRKVEPRILEVLPAAVLRLPKHFDLDFQKHAPLAQIVEQLKKGLHEGAVFEGIEYKKIKVWLDLPLRDKRTKPQTERRALKTFRLSPNTIKKLKEFAKKQNCTETQALETLIHKNSAPAF